MVDPCMLKPVYLTFVKTSSAVAHAHAEKTPVAVDIYLAA